MPEPLLPDDRRVRFHQALHAIDGVGLDGARVLGDGYVTQAWLLADGRTVARIPKHEWGERDLAYEVSLLPTLQRYALGIETPRNARAISDPAGFVGALHDLVIGHSLADRADSIAGRSESLDLARDLGRFLSALHAIPVDAFTPLGPDPYPRDLDKWIEAARPYLDTRGHAWMEAQRVHLAALAPPTEVRVFTHGDLWRHHILLDDDDRLRGVIDFGLGSCMDPAWDLRSCVPGGHLVDRLGAQFSEVLLQHYTQPLDALAVERAQAYGAVDEIGDVYYELAILNRTPSSEFLARVRARIDAWDGD